MPELLENVPLAIRRNMWYMHDGPLAHFSVNVRRWLKNNNFPKRWIGCSGPGLRTKIH